VFWFMLGGADGAADRRGQAPQKPSRAPRRRYHGALAVRGGVRA
jgi:hypothetical protein